MLHPHILMRRLRYSGASSVFTGRCFGFCVFRVVSFIQPNSSGYFNSGGSLFSNERHTMAWWWAIHCESLSGWRNTSIVLVVKMTFYDQTFHLCFWHRLNFVCSSLVHSTTQSSPDISRRSAITRVAMQNLDNQIWKSRIAISTKLKLHNNCILYLSSCTALSAGQSPREMYSRLMPSISGVCESC